MGLLPHGVPSRPTGIEKRIEAFNNSVFFLKSVCAFRSNGWILQKPESTDHVNWMLLEPRKNFLPGQELVVSFFFFLAVLLLILSFWFVLSLPNLTKKKFRGGKLL